MRLLTQEQLDDAVRKAKGRNAVEGLAHEDNERQIYTLSNGTLLEVNKHTGLTVIVAGKIRKAK